MLLRRPPGRIGSLARRELHRPIALLRAYHDKSFGYRTPRAYQLPDYTPDQLANRVVNAPLLRYIDSVRQHAHRAARIDPLDLLEREEVAALDPSRYGLTDASKKYRVDGILWSQQVGETEDSEDWRTLDEIVKLMRSTYIGRIAYEFMHSPNKSERLWWAHMLESENSTFIAKDTPQERLRIWQLMARSETFDQYLQLRFPNLKRYGLEGAESMLPALDTLFGSAAEGGIESIVLCMPHRGRLSLLTDLLQFSPTALFHKIKGGSEIPEGVNATGDVISHLAASPTLDYNGHRVNVSLLQNPSHLEAVNPVALGKTRAKQYTLIKETNPDCSLGDKVLCVQIHGDAAFTGQGVVMEGLGLSNLPHYTSGGSVHIVVNNGIGYTTPGPFSRSSLYSSDIGKMINAPVLHVNGDYPEDVARALRIAYKYREFFRKDIIVDLLTYRRWGHNELDEPAFTQPAMYTKIRSRESVPRLYENKLIDEGSLTPSAATEFRTAYKAQLESHLKSVETHQPEPYSPEQQGARWAELGLVWPGSAEGIAGKDPLTGVDIAKLKEIGQVSVRVPDAFEVHPRLQRHIKHRLSSLESGQGVDWGTAEALAFGSLILDGYDVRISGQDVGRGTFSHRHAMLVDQKTEEITVPLNNLSHQNKLELANSSLSELAVLGFEYGMSWENPTLLPIWEAQFGDFFNGAQVIIDTFISSAQTKWLKQSGLVMLLPHGLDGAGPEHSSSRIERMLQLTNDTYEYHEGAIDVNLHVANPTTPAQYFHLLRRQMKRNHRKPLVVASPKGLLRSPVSASALTDMDEGTKFHPVLLEPTLPTDIRKILIVSGKVYYDLLKERQVQGLDAQIALVRVEEISPFPFAALAEALGQLTSSTTLPEVCWVQEEARNQGAWGHVSQRIDSVFEHLGWDSAKLKYVGRRESEVPSVGSPTRHAADKQTFIAEALKV